MKRVLSIVLTLLLIVGGMGFAATSAAMTKSGMVKEFTETSVTVLENGKEVTYQVHDHTKVTSNGSEADFASTINKGVTITYKASKGMIMEADIPPYGLQTQGEVAAAPQVSEQGFLVDLKLQSVDTRTNTSDTNIVAASATSKVIGEEADDTFLLSQDGKKATLGDLDVVDKSLVVKYDGKALTENVDFKLVTTKPAGSVAFREVEFTTPIADGKKLEISFKKVIREITVKETSKFPYAKNMLVELNGKAMPMVVDGVNAFVNTNLAGEVVYVNSYYKNQKMIFYGLQGTKMVVGLLKGDTVVMVDRLTVSPEATVANADGDVVALTALKGNTTILLTTDPEYGYQVVSVYAQK